MSVFGGRGKARTMAVSMTAIIQPSPLHWMATLKKEMFACITLLKIMSMLTYSMAILPLARKLSQVHKLICL